MSSSIEEIFRVAVNDQLGDQRGGQARLAKASGVHPPYLNAILKGNKPGTDEVRRRIAEALGYPGRKYEEFLDIGRALLDHGLRPEAESGPLSADEMSARGFFAVPFSGHMRLAGGGRSIPVTEDQDRSVVVVHGPSLGRRSSRDLQAFRVAGDCMEPIVAEGGIVVADISVGDLAGIREGGLYVLCWDLRGGQCAVRRLRWAEKSRLLSIESADPASPPVFKDIKDVILVGEIIWSCRTHSRLNMRSSH